MTSFLTNKIRAKLIFLGIYQIIGSLIGLLFSVVATELPSYNFISVSICAFTFLFYMFNFYCGILLIIGNPLGLVFSMLTQIFQLLNFSISGFIFRYICGIYFALSINFSAGGLLSTDFRISSYMFGFIDNRSFIVSLNITAVIILIFTTSVRIQISKERIRQQINLLGNN